MTGMFRNYIRHPDGRIEQCDDVVQFAAWYGNIANRQIARTAVPFGRGDKKAVIVSTVFLGMDNNWTGEGDPVLFETMALGPNDEDVLEETCGDEYRDFCVRYHTEDEARAGHAAIVGRVQESLVSQQEVDQVVDGVLDDGLTEGLRLVVKGPYPVPLPKPRKIKAPLRTAADPTCADCAGVGTHLNSFGMTVMCECTIVRRK